MRRVVWMVLVCLGCTGIPTSTDTGTSWETDTDSDADSDTDIDADADTDSDADSDTDTETDTAWTVSTGGAACLDNAPIAEGDPVSITAYLTCIDPSVTEVVSSSCTITQTGARLDVAATAELRALSPSATATTMPTNGSTSCVFVEASCELTAGLTAGSYILAHGGVEAPFDVPGPGFVCTGGVY